MIKFLEQELGDANGVRVGGYVLDQEEVRTSKKSGNPFRRVTIVAGNITLKWMIFRDDETGEVPSYDKFDVVVVQVDTFDSSSEPATIMGKLVQR